MQSLNNARGFVLFAQETQKIYTDEGARVHLVDVNWKSAPTEPKILCVVETVVAVK